MLFRFWQQHHLQEPAVPMLPTKYSDLESKIAKLICGHERHALIKSSYDAFRAYTTPRGQQFSGPDALLLGNCVACGSTISIPCDMEREHCRKDIAFPSPQPLPPGDSS